MFSDLDLLLPVDPLELTLCKDQSRNSNQSFENAIRNSEALKLESRVAILRALALKKQINWLKQQQEVWARNWRFPFVGALNPGKTTTTYTACRSFPIFDAVSAHEAVGGATYIYKD